MKKTIGILIFDGAEVLDFAGPFEVFSVASEIHDYCLFNVVTIAKERKPVTAVNGLSVNPDFSFEDAPPLSLLVIAGGSGTRDLLNDSHLLRWVLSAYNNADITASICSGARILGVLGLLHERPYCTHHGVYDHMQELAPSAIPKKSERFVESANNLYTSGGISAGIDLSFHILKTLHGDAIASATAEYMEYDLREFKESQHASV